MTRAPANLLALRTLLLTHLDNAPGPDDLQPAELGVVGDPAHRGGYHCGSDRVVKNDYSVVESPRDRAGLSDYAAALDVGQFKVTTPKGTFDLRHYSKWLVAQCAANTADTRDIREVIYSPDGTTVKRWDRLGKRSSGDSSHRWHTHISFHRDAIKAGRDQTAVVRRYLTTIGLIKAAPTPTVEAPEMELTDKIQRDTGRPQRTVDDVLADLSNLRNWLVSPPNTPGVVSAPAAGSPLALLAEMAKGDRDLDEQIVISGVLAGLAPEKIAALIPSSLAKQVADELAKRLQG